MAIEITIGPARRLVAAGRIFSGERAAVRVECAAAPRALYLLGDRREPVAACLEFAADGEGAWTGAVETATRQVAALVDGVRAGKALLLVAALEAADGSQLALGTVSMVASAMPEELEDLPPDIIDPFVRRAAIRALAAGLSTGGGSQREIRKAVDSLLSRLAAFGLCLALAAARPAGAAVEWQDVPPDTAVEVDALTNTPAAVAAQIAAATNNIPRPDMGAYVRKSGDTMTGNLRAPSVTAGLYSSATTVHSDGVDVAGFVESAHYGSSYIQISGGPGGDRYLYWPAQGGTIATQESSSPYADPAPWSLAAALLPVQDGAAAETNAVGDVGEVVLVNATWQDAQFSLATEDRPPPYDYAAPTGTWSIADDPAGAASSISASGLLSASRRAAGNVTVQYAAGAAGTQGRAVFLQQTRAETPLPGFVELPGSLRNAWSTNLLARLAAIDYSAVSEYAHCYGGMDYGPEYIADALSPFNDLGDSLALPTGPNAGFFWPALATNLLPRSVARVDIGADGRPWAASPVLFVSPHWAVQAAHWNFAPAAILCTNYEAGAFVTLPASRRVPMPGGSDLALVRYRSPAPPQCVARLIRRADLEALSPSLFDRACGIHFSQHGTVHPFSIGGASAGGPDWAATGFPAATNACHLTHGGDSGQPIALVTPRAQVVWLACHYTQYGGPWLYDEAHLAWIEAQLAADGEAPTYWRAEDLR